MKSQIIIAALLFIGINSFASEKTKSEKASTKVETPSTNVYLTGTIVDEQSKETLAGVEVTIEGTDLKTYTDFEGKFSFDGIKPGTYKIATKYVSYNKAESRQVTVKANEMHSLNMELTAQNSLPQLETTNNQTMLAGK
jgi:hypothetical protein